MTSRVFASRRSHIPIPVTAAPHAASSAPSSARSSPSSSSRCVGRCITTAYTPSEAPHVRNRSAGSRRNPGTKRKTLRPAPDPRTGRNANCDKPSVRRDTRHPTSPAPTPPNTTLIPAAPPKAATRDPAESATAPTTPPAAPRVDNDATIAGAASPPVTKRRPPPSAAAAPMVATRPKDARLNEGDTPSPEAFASVSRESARVSHDDVRVDDWVDVAAADDDEGASPPVRMDLRCAARTSSRADMQDQGTRAARARRWRAAPACAVYILDAVQATMRAPTISVHRRISAVGGASSGDEGSARAERTSSVSTKVSAARCTRASCSSTVVGAGSERGRTASTCEGSSDNRSTTTTRRKAWAASTSPSRPTHTHAIAPAVALRSAEVSFASASPSTTARKRAAAAVSSSRASAPPASAA